MRVCLITGRVKGSICVFVNLMNLIVEWAGQV